MNISRNNFITKYTGWLQIIGKEELEISCLLYHCEQIIRVYKFGLAYIVLYLENS